MLHVRHSAIFKLLTPESLLLSPRWIRHSNGSWSVLADKIILINRIVGPVSEQARNIDYVRSEKLH